MATLPSRLIGAVHHIARAELRFPALLRARLQRDGETDAAITLRNVSASGFMGLVSVPIRAGSRIRLVLPVGRAVEADVRWSLNGQIGCRLDGRFSRAQLALLTTLGAARGLTVAGAGRVAIGLGILLVLLR